MIKLIDSTQYHLWTDALHARVLARQTQNAWDRGAYVRWSILSAWTAFETVCGDVLDADGLGNRFKERINDAVAKKGLPSVDWGKGIWQQALAVYSTRKEFTHVDADISQSRLLATVDQADQAINVLRDAIKDVCRLAGVASPRWADDDDDRGWDSLGMKDLAHSHVIRAGAQPDDPERIRICYVMKGNEYEDEVWPAGTPHGPKLDSLLSRLNVPVSVIRAYRGKELIEERKFTARGG